MTHELSSRLNSAVSTNSIRKSPVDFFRELLAMTPEQRKRAIANRPPGIQKQILAKVREYQSLSPDERELRLRATELRWYLLPLMKIPSTNHAARAAALARIPPEDRKLVKERLQQWSLLPPSFQQTLLNSQATARYFSQLDNASAEERQRILSRISPARRAKLEQGLDYWRRLSPHQRQRTLNAFNHFFELTSQEKKEALNTLSKPERRQMERTLRAYSKLTPAQREQCIRSFEKFASMSLAERQLFLKNAERWKMMTPDQRQTWRNLVEYAPIQPPMPAGFNPPPTPPLPIGFKPHPTPPHSQAQPASLVTTNRN